MGYLILDEKNFLKLKKKLKEAKEKGLKVLVRAKDFNFNKKVLENKEIDGIIGLEIHNEKDFMKQRNSGMNEFMARLAKQHNTKIALDIESLKKIYDEFQKTKILARMIQNISLCKRAKAPMILFKKGLKKQDVMSFFLTFGADTSFAKKCWEETKLFFNG